MLQVNVQELSWSTYDGVQIFAQLFTPQRPKAGILLTHGWGDHQGRYSELTEYFASRGYMMLAHDWRGHGRSAGKRGMARNIQQFCDDLELAIAKFRLRLPEPMPIFLYGHSFGGMLTLNYLLKNPERCRSEKYLAGAILTSPLFELSMPIPQWKLRVGNVLRRFAPGVRLRSGINLWQLSEDRVYTERIATDPLRQGRISLGFFFDMLEQMRWTQANAEKLALNSLLLHGANDLITSPTSSQLFAERATERVHLKIWSDMLHEPHASPCKAQVFAYIDDWLCGQLSSCKN